MEPYNIQFYVAIVAAAMYVFETNKDKPISSRFFITLSSAGFGFSVSPELSHYIFGSLVLTGVLITALGFLFLELSSSIVSDTGLAKNIIKKRWGNSDE